jgi:hypothetical protein
VREQLVYSALLRLPQSMSKEEKMAKVGSLSLEKRRGRKDGREKERRGEGELRRGSRGRREERGEGRTSLR